MEASASTQARAARLEGAEERGTDRQIAIVFFGCVLAAYAAIGLAVYGVLALVT